MGGGRGVGPLCVQQRGCADKHTNVTLSFCEPEQLCSTERRSNLNTHTFAASLQPPLALGDLIQEEQPFNLSVGKVYPHVSSLVCGGTGPRSTHRNKGRILLYSREHRRTGAEC